MFHASAASLKQFLTILAPSVGLELANGLPFLLNFVFLGTFGDPLPISVFGLCNFFNNVLVFPVMFSLIEVAGVLFSKNFGAKDFREFSRNLYRTLLTFAWFFAIYYALCFFSEELFLASNVQKDLAARSARLIKISWPVWSLMLVNRAIQTLLSSQNVIHEFLYPNLLGIVLGVVLAKIFVVDLGMLELGIVPARAVQELTALSFGIYFLRTKGERLVFKPPSLAEVLRGYKAFLNKLLFSALGTIAEWATFEVNTFLAVQLHDLDQLAVFLDWTGISPLFYMLGFGCSTTVRIVVGQLMGRGACEGARNRLMAFFFYIFCFSLVLSVSLWCVAWPLAHVYVKNELIAQSLYETILVLAIFLSGYIFFYPVFQVFRLIDEERFFVKILVTLYISINTGVAWTLAFKMDKKAFGLVLGHGLANVVVQFVFMHRIFVVHDWTRHEEKFSERLLSHELEIRTPIVPSRISEALISRKNSLVDQDLN